jgi:hypothetical protein
LSAFDDAAQEAPERENIFDIFMAEGRAEHDEGRRILLDTLHPTSEADRSKKSRKSLFRNILHVTPLDSKIKEKTSR